MVNAIFIFVTFLFSIPAIVMPMTRGWVKLYGMMVVFCAIFTLVLGLDIWFGTLKTRTNLGNVWTTQPPSTRSLVQQNVRDPTSPYQA
jgi:protein-S-isoprenylcysteine O-methyltransferase Ste14